MTIISSCIHLLFLFAHVICTSHANMHLNRQTSSFTLHRVGSAEIDYVTAEVRVHMQQDWCSLFKSEMFAWLNQYLTRGTLPSMADRPGECLCFTYMYVSVRLLACIALCPCQLVSDVSHHTSCTGIKSSVSMLFINWSPVIVVSQGVLRA